MRQVNIRTLRAELCTQLQDLPFEITKKGKIIGVVCTQTKAIRKQSKTQSTETAAKKVCVHKPKATISTGWVNPVANSVLAPKG